MSGPERPGRTGPGPPNAGEDVSGDDPLVQTLVEPTNQLSFGGASPTQSEGRNVLPPRPPLTLVDVFLRMGPILNAQSPIVLVRGRGRGRNNHPPPPSPLPRLPQSSSDLRMTHLTSLRVDFGVFEDFTEFLGIQPDEEVLNQSSELCEDLENLSQRFFPRVNESSTQPPPSYTISEIISLDERTLHTQMSPLQYRFMSIIQTIQHQGSIEIDVDDFVSTLLWHFGFTSPPRRFAFTRTFPVPGPEQEHRYSASIAHLLQYSITNHLTERHDTAPSNIPGRGTVYPHTSVPDFAGIVYCNPPFNGITLLTFVFENKRSSYNGEIRPQIFSEMLSVCLRNKSKLEAATAYESSVLRDRFPVLAFAVIGTSLRIYFACFNASYLSDIQAGNQPSAQVILYRYRAPEVQSSDPFWSNMIRDANFAGDLVHRRACFKALAFLKTWVKLFAQHYNS